MLRNDSRVNCLRTAMWWSYVRPLLMQGKGAKQPPIPFSSSCCARRYAGEVQPRWRQIWNFLFWNIAGRVSAYKTFERNRAVLSCFGAVNTCVGLPSSTI